MPLVMVRRGAALGVVLALVVAGTALADDLRPDVDDVLAGNQASVDLGELAPGASRDVSVAFTLVCRTTSHVAAGGTFAIDAVSTSSPDGGSVLVTPGQLTVPDTWPAPGQPCTSDEDAATIIPATVHLTAPSAVGTDLTYDIQWALSGDEPLSNMPFTTITLDVVAPPPPADTTEPELHGMPVDIEVHTTAGGATVTYTTPTASDDTDASPEVGCTPTSGSLFAVGTTTVTCIATDDAGNTASATFTVTVVHDTPPPARDLTGTWDRPLANAVPALVAQPGRTVPLKLTVRDGADRQGPADISAPALSVARLAACGPAAATVSTSPAGSFAWADGVWQHNLDTSGLGTGCVRVTASVGDDLVATALLQLGPDAATTTKAKGRR